MSKKKLILKEFLDLYGSMPDTYNDPEYNIDLGELEHHKKHHIEITQWKAIAAKLAYDIEWVIDEWPEAFAPDGEVRQHLEEYKKLLVQ